VKTGRSNSQEGTDLGEYFKVGQGSKIAVFFHDDDDDNDKLTLTAIALILQ
jgi:hypothetical protein